jgi:rubrerythrin
MDEIETVEDVLRRAIQNEIESGDTYMRAIDLVRDRRVREGLRMAAQEERRHQAALERLLANWEHLPASFRQLSPGAVWQELTGEQVDFVALKPDATFVDMCLFARRKEQLAYESYRALAEQSEGEIRNLFEIMAQEELQHERMFRHWYEKAAGAQ